MKSMKKILISLLCLFLVLPWLAPFTAASNHQNETEIEAEDAGETAGKDEVVYATLSPSGAGKELYIVNSLEVTEAGEIADYGAYSNVKNLTDLSEISQSGDVVEMSASVGKFYYQGTLDHTNLPWDFKMTYYLDGEEVTPEELAGKDGTLEIEIDTSENEAIDPIFYENYLLQISFAFDGEKTSNIETDEGILANAGKDIQVTYTVLPEEEAVLSVTADVTDFELASIDISAIPQNMSIDAPDTDEFTAEIGTLADALQSIDDGVLELKGGATELHEGTTALQSGSTEYKEGIQALNNGSGELVSGSKAIQDALATIDQSLGDTGGIDGGDFNMMTEGLEEFASALREIKNGLVELKDGFGAAYEALDEAITAIPGHEVSEEEIIALKQSNANQDTVDKLLEVYTAALTVKGTYEQVKDGFSAVTSTLETMITSLETIVGSIEELIAGFNEFLEKMDPTSGLKELQEGISTLSANYQAFHSGLVTYTEGVGELAAGYTEIDAGIGELNNGTGELASGVSELRDGTDELAEATQDMPEQVTEEIDEMLAQYDKSDFEAVSFVSDKNEEVNSVQFVLKTEPIEKAEETDEAEEESEKKSLWERFLDLFR
ncbi:YhgE/Pip domain-containing protein [Oceanobacillus alkalisoli]|uniref:YhgE/Pip domain-containing protein n=1 Tax=Oceanobacillus alkalisoli TaxID=2925113 RepID=UPI001EE3EF06|nr:YhgE/Pip domain-containing protein [Oceanobacillus alkalisoli]MCG5103989.1 YhgE/Pip domain-containing protein [Oceanobacillus alkalisoli]